MRLYELISRVRINELKMSPSSLKQMAASIEADAGMEFEMVVPESVGVDTDQDNTTEDFDEDRRIQDWDSVLAFFSNGHNSRGDVDRLERYLEHDHRADNDEFEANFREQFNNQIAKYVSEYLVDELELDRESKEFTDRVADAVRDKEDNEDYMRAFDNKITRHIERFATDYHKDGWIVNRFGSMRDVYNEYTINWPYRTTHKGNVIGTIAASFGSSIGRPYVSSDTYHGAPRQHNTYAVEPDSSIEVSDDEHVGVEFVSPVLPATQILADLHKVKKWAAYNDCYSNESTGLHINVSLPGKDFGKLDYVKLAVFLGDNYVLDQFDRIGNNYCESAITAIKQKSTPDKIALLFGQMKAGLNSEISQVIASSNANRNSSINVKNGYIEFRSPGGDWLNSNFEHIESTLYRFIVALDIALDETKYKEEYAKKLYKLLSGNTSAPNVVALFSNFNAGRISKAALLSTIKAMRGRDASDNYAIFNLDTGQILSTFLADDDTDAKVKFNNIIRHAVGKFGLKDIATNKVIA